MTIQRYKEDNIQINHDYECIQDWDTNKNNHHDNSTTITIQQSYSTKFNSTKFMHLE